MAKYIPILLAAPLAAMAMAGPAAAQEEQTVLVPTSDLNLANQKGRDRLATRVRAAVRQVCGADVHVSLRERAFVRQCQTTAMRNSEAQMARLFENNGTELAERGELVVGAR